MRPQAVPEDSRPNLGGDPDAGARHRRKHRDLHPGERVHVEADPVARSRKHHDGDGTRAAGRGLGSPGPGGLGASGCTKWAFAPRSGAKRGQARSTVAHGERPPLLRGRGSRPVDCGLGLGHASGRPAGGTQQIRHLGYAHRPADADLHRRHRVPGGHRLRRRTGVPLLEARHEPSAPRRRARRVGLAKPPAAHRAARGRTGRLHDFPADRLRPVRAELPADGERSGAHGAVRPAGAADESERDYIRAAAPETSVRRGSGESARRPCPGSNRPR